ncbi:hypothetical protein HYT60_01050 [Candidatus Woesebacteria bacterium]|nr:hypothetical protein [Candidatus Woesebacteria bacterium]
MAERLAEKIKRGIGEELGCWRKAIEEVRREVGIGAVAHQAETDRLNLSRQAETLSSQKETVRQGE